MMHLWIMGGSFSPPLSDRIREHNDNPRFEANFWVREWGASIALLLN
jgi:hypothetical protein